MTRKPIADEHSSEPDRNKRYRLRHPEKIKEIEYRRNRTEKRREYQRLRRKND